MKKSTILYAAFAAIAFAGCSKDKINPTDGRVALQVSGCIQTRTYDDKWESNDAIGIYMVNPGDFTISEGAENCYYSTSDGSSSFSTPEETVIYFPVDGSRVDVLAYYPYQKTLKDGELTLDISDQTDLSAIDLMTAKVQSTSDKPVDKNHPKVTLNFVHLYTKLELNIFAGDGVSQNELKGLKVEITNQRTKGIYDPLFEAYGIETDPILPVVLNTNAEGTLAQAILLPNDIAGNTVIPEREFVFSLAAMGGKVFRWSIPNDKLFERGDKSIYNITINHTNLDVIAIITD